MITTTEELAKLGGHLKSQLAQFITDRSLCEIQWLKNLRQHMGKYDPEVLARIPDERSHVYPRDTRVKIKGGVAKMMEMMFPGSYRNWELATSTNPSIPKDALQSIIDALQQRTDEQGQPIPVTSEDIEREVHTFAVARMEKMQDEIADQMEDPGLDHPQLCKRVVRSGYIYGFGVAQSPIVRTQSERVWEFDPKLGTYIAKTKTLKRPYAEYFRIWDAYPDLSASSWEDQEMFFRRYVLTRHAFRKLADRPDFKGDVIKEYLRENASGNYEAKTYEAELQLLAKTSNLADRTARRYEVYRGLGFISAHVMHAAGIEVDEDEMDQDILADLWFIDDVVIKAEKAAFGERPSDQYHAFIYAEDEDSGLTGIGLPEEVRDSQMSLCASTRCLMDNMAASAGPINEVNIDLLPPGRKTLGPIHAFMNIDRTGDGAEANYPALRQYHTTSHVADIINIVTNQRQQLDVESNLPAYSMGAMQNQPLGEAFRTTSNMSMLQGAANMVTKDTVRAFDKFNASMIGSILKWNMEFNPNEDLKGDYQVRALGNISLVAKEVRGAALDQFVTTLTPEERAILDTYGLLIDRLKARDLPTNRVLPKKEAEAVIQGMREAASQASQVEQGLTAAKTADATASAEKKKIDAAKTAESFDATIQEMLSRVEVNMANAKSAEDRIQLENLKTLLASAVEGRPQ